MSKVIKGKRAVAFLDILGFKKMIQDNTLDEVARKYELIIDQLQGMMDFYKDGDNYYNDKIQYFIASDSIVVIANEDNKEAYKDLIAFVFRFLQLSIVHKMPLRGGITYGDVYVNNSRNIFLGQGIVDAVQLEGKQEWIGVAIDDTATLRYSEELSQDYLGPIFKVLLPMYDVSIKERGKKRCQVINWRLNIVVEKGVETLFSPSEIEGVQVKIDNTLEFAKYIQEQEFDYIQAKNPNELPMIFRRFFIGNKSWITKMSANK